MSGSKLDQLHFVNRALRELPLEELEENYPRSVPNAILSRTKPTPLNDPKLVAVSKPALSLVDLDNVPIDDKFINVFAGNEILPGSETAAHCYCGHQFGVFAGQLGDGAAIYLGEVKNSKGEVWLLQLKGAGPTPFSREADGRKVLRSSIREFLCSEAMHHLGVPTTRAGTIIVSSDTVIRDQFYDGHPKAEKCSVILRIAPSFIRFGSFEIFKPLDPETMRMGPSVGRIDILTQLTDYTIRHLFPEINSKQISAEEKYKEFYKEVVIRTAKLVAKWQTIGWVHGVLNTDNMSVLGLTLDYGPYGFMDQYDSDHIPNTSDTDGRYSYRKQPEICFWNLIKFAEALNPLVPLDELKTILRENYFSTFNSEYLEIMAKKFGLKDRLTDDFDDPDGVAIASDNSLNQMFLTIMARVGGDFTNCFRLLSKLKLPRLPEFDRSFEELVDQLVEQSSTRNQMIRKHEAFFELPMVQLRLILMKNFAAQLKDDELSKRISAKMEHYEEIKTLSDSDWTTQIRQEWSDFLQVYSNRLEFDTRNLEIDKLIEEDEKRRKLMNSTNPRIVLRNYLAEEAIKAAEAGNYEVINRLLKALETPFSDSPELEQYTSKPPQTCNLRVSCSS